MGDHDLKALQAENDHLRASLANGGGPCAYCALPQERWAECASGFPGCGRYDDAMLCPNVGAWLEKQAEVDQITAERDQARTALADSERMRVGIITADQAKLLVRMLEPLARANRAIGEEPGPFRFETGTGYRNLSREDLRSAGEAYRLLKAASTTPKETTHVEG